jgi:hypothetical protein
VSIRATLLRDELGWSALWFPASVLPPALYSFQLVVHGTYASSAPSVAQLDTSALPAALAAYQVNPLAARDWMPSLRMHAPKTVLRALSSLFSLDLIESLCAAVPDAATAKFEWLWTVTPLGPTSPDGSGATLAANASAMAAAMKPLKRGSIKTDLRDLFVPKNILVAGWNYRVHVRLTLTTFNSYGGLGRRLLANDMSGSGATGVAEAALQVSVGRSALVAEIAGPAKRNRPSDLVLSFDASGSHDPDVDSSVTAAGAGAAISFQWKCYDGRESEAGSITHLPPCAITAFEVLSWTLPRGFVSAGHDAGLDPVRG